MEEHILFLNMFSLYEPQESLRQLLLQAELISADIDPATRRITACIHSPAYIPQRLITQAQTEISSLYGLNRLDITVTHPAEQMSQIEPEELMALFVSVNSLSRGILAGARWNWNENTLTIDLRANGKDALQECVPVVCRRLKERFGADVSIQINAGEKLDGQALFDAMEKMRDNILSDLPRNVPAVKAEAPPGALFPAHQTKQCCTDVGEQHPSATRNVQNPHIPAAHRSVWKRYVFPYIPTYPAGSGCQHCQRGRQPAA